jgi:AraC-like DNA-binding protein
MQRTSSCSWVKGIAEVFAAEGIAVPRLFADAGIDASRLEHPQERFAVDEVSRLWELGVAASGKPALGLDRALAARHVNVDVVGYAMLSSPNLRAGLEELARYMAVISDAASFEVQPEPGGDCWLVLGGLGNERPVPRQRYAFGMLTLLVLCQWLTRREVRPIALELCFPQPPEAARYREVFGGTQRFSRPANRMLLAGADLRLPLPSRNPTLLALHESVLAERLTAVGGARTSLRVSEEIVRRLHRGEPRRDEVAASLALADRTLQRRLQAEHTSFAELLDATRRELACKYLAEEHHTLAEVADLLGFVDQSNFFRACRRWFGESPAAHRRRVLGPAVAQS